MLRRLFISCSLSSRLHTLIPLTCSLTAPSSLIMDSSRTTTDHNSDLETYQAQLSQVEQTLVAVPDNEDLLSLKSELEELIELTKAAIAQQENAASSSKADARKAAQTASSGKNFVAGDDCLAKYSGDGQWYPGRVASVGGSTENRQYSVVFKGYNTTELVNAAQIKALPANYVAPTPAGGASKRKLTKVEEEERERKKRKNEKKVEAKATKAKEQTAKQATWQKFAKKSEKKGIHIAGVAGTSIFKTPENPLGRGQQRRRPAYPHMFSLTDRCSGRDGQRQGHDRGQAAGQTQVRPHSRGVGAWSGYVLTSAPSCLSQLTTPQVSNHTLFYYLYIRAAVGNQCFARL